MYVIINKKPIDVFKITAVSNPMEISGIWNQNNTCLGREM